MYILFAEKESSKERILIGELHRLSVRGSRNRAGNCGTLGFMMRRPPPEEARMPVTKYLKKRKKKKIYQRLIAFLGNQLSPPSTV